MEKSIIFQGMCYSGKSTLGKMTADALGVDFLDSQDLFFKIYGISEIDYLKNYGREQFSESEKRSLNHNFDGVFSCGGSAVYYDSEMNILKNKYHIIWLDVDYKVIVDRKEKEGRERPIVFPEGINSFEELYNERAKLYRKYATHVIKVTENESVSITVQKILRSLINEK